MYPELNRSLSRYFNFKLNVYQHMNLNLSLNLNDNLNFNLNLKLNKNLNWGSAQYSTSEKLWAWDKWYGLLECLYFAALLKASISDLYCSLIC